MVLVVPVANKRLCFMVSVVPVANKRLWFLQRRCLSDEVLMIKLISFDMAKKQRKLEKLELQSTWAALRVFV